MKVRIKYVCGIFLSISFTGLLAMQEAPYVEPAKPGEPVAESASLDESEPE